MGRFVLSNLFVLAIMLASVLPTPTLAAPNPPAGGLATLPSDMIARTPGNAEIKSSVPQTAIQAERLELRLQRATFDPLLQTPALPSELSSNAYPGDGSGYYLVQFRGPILPEWKEAVQKQGAMVLDYVPQFAFIVRMDNTMAARVRSLDVVRWVGLYQPAFRLSTDLDQVIATKPGETVRIVARSFTGEPADALLSQFDQLKAAVRDAGKDSGGGSIFELALPAAAIPAIARLSGIAWVEPWTEPILHNAIARSDLAMNKNGVESRLGLYGAGQIVVVGDTGVSTGNPSTIHADFSGRVFSGATGPGSTCNNWTDTVDHGTHVAGSVLGSGYRSGAITTTHSYAGTNAGIAPEALLFAWGFCSDFSGLPATNPYTDYYNVMYSADSRVRTNTNSWGYTNLHGLYNTFSKETDRFLWDHRDMTVLYSAGNDGTDANSNGIVDTGSVGVPASSKNIITVGASENYRLTGGYNPGGPCSTWGTCWPSDFPTNPVHDDRLSNNTSGMAAFSGRGPTLDGRLKPDVVAPGSNIVSTRYPGASTGWGVYDAYYLYMGGTSMATPLVAGGSAIVREFYSDNYGIASPSAALVKATLVNGAYNMTPGQYGAGATQDVVRRPDINQGWGRVDLYNSLVYDAPRKLWFYQHTTGLTTAQEYSVTLRITNSSDPFRITLVWTDYPGTEAANGGLVNDLDLTVVAPNGTTYTGNDLLGDGVLDGDVDHANNVEGIDLGSPSRGDYIVRVRAYNTPHGPQPFALVASGDLIQVWTSCYARINSGTTFSSTDADAVQQAVDAAVTNDTVKVAGDCVGVQSRAGTSQSVYISKTLTLRGGYTTTNWATSNPVNNPTNLDADQSGRVVYLTGGNGVNVTIDGLTMRNGNAGGNDGGGIYGNGTLTLTNSSIRNALNTNRGGGIYNLGTLALTSTNIISNTAAWGGGLYNNGTLKISASTFASNTTTGNGGGLNINSGVASVTNSTFSGNSAQAVSAQGGGGIMAWSGALTLTHVTLSGNSAPTGGGIFRASAATAIQNTIVANSTSGGNCSGTLSSLGYNLSSDATCANFTATGDLINANPLLGPLQDNGGNTWTHALLFASPAVDRIPNGANGCGITLSTDQRGFGRPAPAGGSCDVGAVEAQARCFARIGVGTTFTSEDATAVQVAVDTAPAGDTVKVAGICTGVQHRAGTDQTVYISKTLTVRGGYTTTNWTTSNPIANPTPLDARQAGRVVVAAGGSSVNVTLENLTVRNGSTSSTGGGILNNFGVLYVRNTIVSGNRAGLGGGIRNEQGALTVVTSTFANNTSSSWGAGIASYSGTLSVSNSTFTSNASAWIGGGIADNGPLTVTNSTFTGNSAQRGGGMFVYWGQVSVNNSTFSGNSSTQSGASYGGGAIEYLFNPTPTALALASLPDSQRASGSASPEPEAAPQALLAAPSATMINSTVVSNTAANTSTSGIWLEGGTLRIGNSIVANNNVTNNVAISGGAFTSQGYNLTNSGAGTPFTAPTDLINTNPLLGPLQDNGGNTWTHALLLASPAIDRIPNGANGCGITLTSDQRGQPRPGTFTRLCDIGAYEAQGIYYRVYLPLVMRN